MLKFFAPETDFSSYEQFHEKFRIDIPENFNFAYDVVDQIAAESPDKQALLWCNDKGKERDVCFAELKEQSNRVANIFSDLCIRKGDRVMLMLKRHGGKSTDSGSAEVQ